MDTPEPAIARPPAPRSRAVLLLGAVVLVQLLLLAGLWEQLLAHAERLALPTQATLAQPGDPFPDVPVRLATGETLDRAALLARAPLLVVIASAGCAACEDRRASLVESLRTQPAAAGLQVLVLGDGTIDWLTAYCRGTNWLPALDTGGQAGRLFTGGIVPYFVLVDRTGAIRAASLVGLDHDFLHELEEVMAADASSGEHLDPIHTSLEGG